MPRAPRKKPAAAAPAGKAAARATSAEAKAPETKPAEKRAAAKPAAAGTTAVAVAPTLPRGERDSGRQAMAAQSESLEALYAAWLDLRTERAGRSRARAEQLARLDAQAGFLLNALGAARTLGRPTAGAGDSGRALATDDGLARFESEAAGKLDTQRQAIAEAGREEETRQEAAEESLRAALERVADAHLLLAKPELALTVHPVGKAQALVEVKGPTELQSVLWMRVLDGRLPSRWGFFHDDAVDLGDAAPQHYEELGVTAGMGEAERDASLTAVARFAPVRQVIPIRAGDAGLPALRLVHHGPIAQLEARSAEGRHEQLLPREVAERLTGWLLRLQLDGRLTLTLEVG